MYACSHFPEKLQAGIKVARGSESSAVDVEYVLAGQGYHRTLKATLHDDSVSDEQNTTYVIAVNITTNFYMDLDQVLLQIYTNVFIN